MPSSQVMSEFSKGKLHSGSKKGPIVKDKKQAFAIMMAEKRKEKGGKGKKRNRKAQLEALTKGKD